MMSYVRRPGAPPPPDLGLGVGSAVTLIQQHRTGVIRWIGELPGVQGVIAGVELVSVCAWLSGIHSELPIERLVVQGPASDNLVLSFSLSSSGCSDHLAPPHQLTQL